MKRSIYLAISVSLLVIVSSIPCPAQTSNVLVTCVQKDTGLSRIVSNPNECGPDETGALRDEFDLQGVVRPGARGIQASNPPVSLKIARVIPDFNQQTLNIEGVNLGSAPTVVLAAGGGGVVPLTIIGANSEVIQARLGTVLPGTYLLMVVNGNGNVQQDTMAITLGAVGAKGDKGDTGPTGHAPVLTWAGDRIAIDGAVTGPNLTGPKGDTGPTGHAPVLTWAGDRIAIDGSATGPHLIGPSGPQGETGATGSSGLSNYKLESYTADCAGWNVCSASYFCDTGDSVLGGGFDVSYWGVAGWTVRANRPFNERDSNGNVRAGWYVQIGNNDVYTKPWEIWLICAKTN